MAKKRRVVMSLSLGHPDADAVRIVRMRKTLYMHPIARGHCVQSGLRLSLPDRNLAPSDRSSGTCWEGSLGGRGSTGEPSSLGMRCDRAVWKDEPAVFELSEGFVVSVEFVNRPMSILQSLSSCLS
jgi:hypothetical protein